MELGRVGGGVNIRQAWHNIIRVNRVLIHRKAIRINLRTIVAQPISSFLKLKYCTVSEGGSPKGLRRMVPWFLQTKQRMNSWTSKKQKQESNQALSRNGSWIKKKFWAAIFSCFHKKLSLNKRGIVQTQKLLLWQCIQYWKVSLETPPKWRTLSHHSDVCICPPPRKTPSGLDTTLFQCKSDQ